MYYKDLTPYEHYLNSPVPHILNIGWLDSEHEFVRGDVPRGFAEKFYAILMSEVGLACRVSQIRGVHSCKLCNLDRYPNPFVGSCQLWIPSSYHDVIYAAPSAIIHYIEDHSYQPPEIFLESVMRLDLNMNFDAQALRENLLRSQCQATDSR